MEHVVIVGAGQAGGRTARALREQGFEGAITLVGDEPLLPYERPPLSKAVLKGEASIDDVMLADEEAYNTHNITFISDCAAEALDPAAHSLELSDGRALQFDHLVLTTGGRAKALPLPGADLAGIHLLRTAADATSVSGTLKKGARIAIIGGGFIGLEVAASARQCGCEVVVLEGFERILARSLPSEAAADVAAVHAGNGVEILTGAKISGFVGPDQVTAVNLDGSAPLPVDAVIVGIGIYPETALAEAAGLDVDNGIVTDEVGRASAPGIYAAGDCAAAFMPRYGRHVRLESYQNANLQAANLARTIRGEPRVYDPVPWLWSDQYDWNLQTAGFPNEFDQIVSRGSRAEGAVVYFSLQNGELRGVTGLGQGTAIARDVRFSQMMMEKGISPAPEQLADTEIALKDLLKAG
ncbi:MAG: FAD-dependent oxidoreductase [Pseudomonadota bacterium]